MVKSNLPKRIITGIKSIAIVLIVTFMFVFPTYAEKSSVGIGGLSLSIGMDKSKLLPDLRSRYKVVCIDEKTCNSVMILREQGPSYEVLASVAFKNERIKSVRKYWSQRFEKSDPSEFFKSFYALLKNLEIEGYKINALSLGEKIEPSYTSKNIWLHYGRKTVNIGYVEQVNNKGTKAPPVINLDEVLE